MVLETVWEGQRAYYLQAMPTPQQSDVTAIPKTPSDQLAILPSHDICVQWNLSIADTIGTDYSYFCICTIQGDSPV